MKQPRQQRKKNTRVASRGGRSMSRRQFKRFSEGKGPRIPPPMPMGGHMQAMRAAHKVCSITDPFCDGARGQKWPDSSSTKTVSIMVRGSQLMTCDAAGAAGSIFIPRWSTGYSAATTMTGALGAMGTVAIPSGFPGSVIPQSYRLVCGGLKISCLLSRMNAAGTFSVTTIPAGNSLDLSGMNFGDYQNEDNAFYPMSSLIDKNLYVIFKSAGNEARQFNPIITTTANTAVNTYDWCPVALAVLGGQASVINVRVEYIYHFEVLFSRADQLSTLGTTPPPQDIVATGASSYIGGKIGNILAASYTAVEKVVEQKAKAYLVSAAARAAGYALGGGAGFAAAGAITDYAMEVN